MILTIEATHTTITRPWDQERQEFSTDPHKEELDRITLYRDIPTLAAYAPTIADTEMGILASSSPEEFIDTIKTFIEQMEDDNPNRTYDDIYWADQHYLWSARLTLHDDDYASWHPKNRGVGVDSWYIEYDPCDDDGYKHLLIAGGHDYRQENRW